MASKLIKFVTRNGITFQAAKFAKLSDGACTCSLGSTTVLVTVASRQLPNTSSQGFLPLTVECSHDTSTTTRNTREQDTLTSRIIDRSIRSSFNKGFKYDTQVIYDLIAVDRANDADVLAINGASASLAISDIPWQGPVGAVRIGIIGDNIIVNPTRREQDDSRLNLVITSNCSGNIIMMDGSCREPILMPEIQKAIKYGIKECQAITRSIEDLRSAVGKPKRNIDLASQTPNEAQIQFLTELTRVQIESILTSYNFDKLKRGEALEEVRLESNEKFNEKFPEVETTIFDQVFTLVLRTTYQRVLGKVGIRCDGRRFDEIRQLNCEVDLSQALHGSALFERGQTQVLCSTTYDSPEVRLEHIKEKNFVLHYKMPPYATNDLSKVRMPDRREIGHGALAEKALRPVVPDQHNMTIRLNCKVLESSGSSSMASVCAGSMSLMDAGVQIKEHVAGVAMGLISNEEQDYILTDILGFEDFHGDMDFKIAGTRKAITAVQLDVKPMSGVPPASVYKALQKAHVARGVIINAMEKAIREPRKAMKDNHPVIKTIHVPSHKRAKLLGPLGSNMKRLLAKTGAKISAIDYEDDSGTEFTIGAALQDNFTIFAPNKDAMNEAEEYIRALLEKNDKEPELEFNGIYTATIQEIRQNGVMVTLYPNMIPAMLPNSQLDIRPVLHPSALNLEVGQQIQIKYFGRDPATGHMRLSRKSLLMSSNARVHQSPLG